MDAAVAAHFETEGRMKMLTVVLSLCTVPLLALQTGAQPGRGGGANDPAIIAVADQYVKATLAADAKAIAALYTDDAVEMPPNEPAVKGKAAIQQLYEKNFKSAKIGPFTLTHQESRASGDTGYDVGTYRQIMTPADGSPIKDSGKYVVIHKRTGGSWKIAYAIYNSDLPPPPPPK
jgi:uncharacterized protein (TIGR02246 family)